MLQETHQTGKETIALHRLVCQISLRRLLHAFRGSVGIWRIKKSQQDLVDLRVNVLSQSLIQNSDESLLDTRGPFSQGIAEKSRSYLIEYQGEQFRLQPADVAQGYCC
jgi:hypothetical protein